MTVSARTAEAKPPDGKRTDLLVGMDDGIDAAQLFAERTGRTMTVVPDVRLLIDGVLDDGEAGGLPAVSYPVAATSP